MLKEGKTPKQLEAPEDLAAHFAYLADTAGYDAVVKAIFTTATGHEMDGDTLVVHFGKKALSASPPAKAKQYAKWPASFQALVAKHERLSFGGDWGLHLHGTVGLEDFEESSLGARAERVLVPMTDFSDWWVYHPKLKNSRGEPALVFASHESGEIEEPGSELFAGSLFLKRLATSLGLAIPLPEGPVASGGGKKGGASKLKSDTFFDGFDDREAAVLGERLFIVRAESSRTATQKVDVWTFGDGAKKVRSVATGIPREDVLLAPLAGERIIVGTATGFSVVDPESSTPAMPRPIPGATACTAFLARGESLYFSHGDGGLGAGLYVTALGGGTPLRVAAAPADAKGKATWLTGFVDLGEVVAVAHTQGVTVYDASAPQAWRELGKVELELDRWSTPTRLPGQRILFASQGQVVDVSDPSKPRVFEFSEEPATARLCAVNGETVLLANLEEGEEEVRRFTPDGEGYTEGKAFKVKLGDEEAFRMFVIGGQLVVLTNDGGGRIVPLG